MTLPKTSHFWFPGLNGLRFIAAALVVVMHTHLNQGRMKLPDLPEWPILLKGFSAVSFFFTLSGFLITYLLLHEQAQTGTISIKQFYLRRVFRIWPLYFIVIAFGVLFYWTLVPALGLHFENDYPHALAIILYVFFMANLMNSLYHVGGILHITWSIAVEEQFYLFWAPLVKKFKKHVAVLIIIITIIAGAVNMCNAANVFGVSDEWQIFIHTLQFHFMGIGAGYAWLVYNHKAWFLSRSVFSNKFIQFALATALLLFYFFYKKNVVGEVLLPLPLGLLYGWLIVNVGVNPKKIFSLENPVLNYLGKISYGIYMYHMPVVYAMAFLFTKTGWLISSPIVYFLVYYGLTFIITIAIASLSFRWIEKPLLSLNNTRPLKSSNPIS